MESKLPPPANSSDKNVDGATETTKPRHRKASGKAQPQISKLPPPANSSDKNVDGAAETTTPRHRKASGIAQPQMIARSARKEIDPGLIGKTKIWLSDSHNSRLAWCAGGALILIFLACWITAKSAYARGRVAASVEISDLTESRKSASTPQVLAKVDLALGSLRDNRPMEAAQILDEIAATSPNLPSLDYLRALAWLQAGEARKAMEFAMMSVSKGERVADAFVVAALGENHHRQEQAGFIDGNRAALDLIAEAMKADPAAAGPRIEAANFFRSLKRNEDAYAEYEAAKLRLFPMDMMLTIEVTLALMDVEMRGTKGDHILELRDNHWPSVFQSALLALKSDNFSKAAVLLEQAEQGLPWSTYSYILNDPALRIYAFHPEMREIFAQAE